MSVNLTPINPSNSTVENVVQAVNAIINVIATVVVTANAAANGSSTTGNGYVVGTFGASTLVGGNIRGGSVNAASNLAVISNVVINSSSSIFNGNSVVNSTALSADNLKSPAHFIGNNELVPVNWTTTGTALQNVDSFLLADFRSVEYTLSIKDNSANGFQMTKILVTHTGDAAYSTEYGTIFSNASLGVFGTSINSTAVVLNFTPLSTNTTINGLRTSLIT